MLMMIGLAWLIFLFAAIRREVFPLHPGLRDRRRVDALAPREGREPRAMEGAGRAAQFKSLMMIELGTDAARLANLYVQDLGP